MTQKIAIWAPSHNFVGLYLRNWGMYRQSEKKLITQQYLLRMYPQYGELRPTSGWDCFGSLGTPATFNGFRVLAALLHGSQVVSVSQTLRRWTEGATYVLQGDHHVGHWPTFLVIIIIIWTPVLTCRVHECSVHTARVHYPCSRAAVHITREHG